MTEDAIRTAGEPPDARIDERTRSRLRSYLQSKDDWNLSRSLKSLIEQAIRDYEHRAIIELLQNSHDAHDAAERIITASRSARADGTICRRRAA